MFKSIVAPHLCPHLQKPRSLDRSCTSPLTSRMNDVGLALIPLLALVGSVILTASLFSGIVERTGFPQVAFFLILGLLLGPHAAGIIDLPLHSPTLEVISTLALALVLFTDAVSLDIGAMRRS